MGDGFTLSVDEHIDFILDNFDFDKVKKVMNYMNVDNLGYPGLGDLRSKSAEMLYKVSNLEYGDYIYHGGLRATKYDDYLELCYNVEFDDSVSINKGEKFSDALRVKQRKEKLANINEKERGKN